MKLSAIALKNLKRNFSFYSLYLFSVSFVLMIYFCFTSFSMNQIIMEKISSDGRVETMCRTVAVFIMAFVIFYMFYSNSFFMRRRMRELGIYSLLGYRKSTILKLLIFENVMICFGGMILGILTGSILHKIVIAGIVTLLGISVDQSAIPLIYPAAVKAILSFVIVVLITLTLSNARLLRKSTLLDLVRLEKKMEKPIHPHAITAILGVGFLSAGYGLALDIMGASYRLDFGTGITDVTVKQTSIDNPIGFSNSVGTLILSDNLYQKMRDSTIDRVTVISINGEKMRSNETAYTALNASMPDNIYLASAWQRESTFVRDASSTFLLICFTTIIFLIATGSILYFQNISSVTYDKPDYEIMLKMGYSHTMIKKCVRRQIQIYYGIPYVIGLLHSIFAMICYKSALMDDLLGRNSAVVAPILLAVAIFSIIYVIYYQLTKRSCYIIALK